MSTVLYCECDSPVIDVDHDAGCRRCGRPVDFSPPQPLYNVWRIRARPTGTLITRHDGDGDVTGWRIPGASEFLTRELNVVRELMTSGYYVATDPQTRANVLRSEGLDPEGVTATEQLETVPMDSMRSRTGSFRVGDRVERVRGTSVEGLTGTISGIHESVNTPGRLFALVQLDPPPEPGIGKQFVAPLEDLEWKGVSLAAPAAADRPQGFAASSAFLSWGDGDV